MQDSKQFEKENFVDEETKTVDTKGEQTPQGQLQRKITKFKSDLDVLTKENQRTLADTQNLIELKEKQISNPWDLDEEKLRSELDFLD